MIINHLSASSKSPDDTDRPKLTKSSHTHTQHKHARASPAYFPHQRTPLSRWWIQIERLSWVGVLRFPYCFSTSSTMRSMPSEEGTWVPWIRVLDVGWKSLPLERVINGISASHPSSVNGLITLLPVFLSCVILFHENLWGARSVS